jgi:DNA topoisomerase-1
MELRETTARDSEPSDAAAESAWSMYSARCAEVAARYYDEIDAVAEPATLDPLVAAEAARLRYVSDRMPGVTQRRAADGGGFDYYDPAGQPISDPDELRRIKALAIPPAWTEVWICPDPNGHLQAVGRDARGRKQYRYHASWRAVRDETKFEHIFGFGRALPLIRQRVEADLSRRGLPRDKIVAAVVRLMERSLARVGNPEYAKQNNSFGLTTLHNDHVRIEGGRIVLDFRGKHGILHHKVVADAKLARILKNCHDLPGAELFKYFDEAGQLRHISSEDVNRYLREITDRHITAKDFRTWAGTNLAVLEIAVLPETKPTKRLVAVVVKRVAAQLGNTPSVCRKSYIHPRVLSSYLDGSLRPVLATAQQCVRALEMWAVEGVVMRLLALWETTGGSAVVGRQ